MDIKPPLRVLLSIVFLMLLFSFVSTFLKNYTHTTLLKSIAICRQVTAIAPNEVMDKKNIAPLVMCLKQQNNALVWWYLDPERLYQIAQPHTPCQWVGRWQAKRGDDVAFVIEFDVYGYFKIDPQTINTALPQHQTYVEGVWSSPNLERILWFSKSRLWPIDDNTVAWLNRDQVVINDSNGIATYYQRQSSRVPNCPVYPKATS